MANERQRQPKPARYTHVPGTFPHREQSDDDDPAIWRRANLQRETVDIPDTPNPDDSQPPE